MFRHVAQNSPDEGIKAYLDFSLFSYNNKTINKVRLRITEHGKKEKTWNSFLKKKKIHQNILSYNETNILQDFFAVY